MLEVISGRAPVVIEEGASLRREQRDIDRPAMPCRTFHVNDQLGASSAFRRCVRHLRLRRLDAGRSIPFVHVLASKDWDISVIARMTDVACPDVWAIRNSFFFSDAWPPALCSAERKHCGSCLFLRSTAVLRTDFLAVMADSALAPDTFGRPRLHPRGRFTPGRGTGLFGPFIAWDHSFGSRCLPARKPMGSPFLGRPACPRRWHRSPRVISKTEAAGASRFVLVSTRFGSGRQQQVQSPRGRQAIVLSNA